MYILGIHGNFGKAEHDAAAVLIKDNEILAAAEEERFVRYKHSVGLMPDRAIAYCLSAAGITMKDVSYVAFPRNTWANFAPRLEAYLWYNFGAKPKIVYVDHHTAHAASAYYISGFKKSLVVTFDQAGDGVSCAVFRGNGKELKRIAAIPFPNSLGVFAAFITQYLGFRSNHDEYKVMGLASYGTPTFDLSELLTYENGYIQFNQEALHPEVMQRHPVFHTDQLPMFQEKTYQFLPPRRLKDEPVTDVHKNLAASAQKAIEEAIFAFIKKHKAPTDEYLCLAGGVAENSVANGKLAAQKLFKDIYVAPACGDSGTALGAALVVAVVNGNTFNKLLSNKVGPSYKDSYIKKILDSYALSYTHSEDIAADVAGLLAEQQIVAWFQGGMEFGPRALGARSLIADPSHKAMQVRVNQIKKREQFRPFAPSILDEKVADMFETYQSSPFMSFTLPTSGEGKKKLVAATHVDGTGRLQTVTKDGSLYRNLIEAFYKKTNVPAILNTSLNSGWEPIVESPEQALAFFFSSEANVLALGNYIVKKYV